MKGEEEELRPCKNHLPPFFCISFFRLPGDISRSSPPKRPHPQSDPSSWPPHSFEVEEQRYATGPLKGELKTLVNLVSGPYVFGKRCVKPATGVLFFNCNSCKAIGHNLSAKAVREGEPGSYTYRLLHLPRVGEHQCRPSDQDIMGQVVRQCVRDIMKTIDESPSRNLRALHRECVENTKGTLTSEAEVKLFAGLMPRFESLQSRMRLRKRTSLAAASAPPRTLKRLESDPSSWAPHCFEVRESRCAFGPLRGQMKTRINLVSAPYVFGKRNLNEKTGVVFLSCNTCKALGHTLHAKGVREGRPGSYRYRVLHLPGPEEHQCRPSDRDVMGHVVKQCTDDILAAIEEAPGRPAREVYEEGVRRTRASLGGSKQEVALFTELMCKFESVAARLYRQREAAKEGKAAAAGTRE